MDHVRVRNSIEKVRSHSLLHCSVPGKNLALDAGLN